MNRTLSFPLTYDEARRVSAYLGRSHEDDLTRLGADLNAQLARCEHARDRLDKAIADMQEEKANGR
jgi:hypothetical protein